MLLRNLRRDGSCKSGFDKVDDEFQALSEGGTPLLQRSPVDFDPGNHSRPCQAPTLWPHTPLLGNTGSSALVLGIGWGPTWAHCY